MTLKTYSDPDPHNIILTMARGHQSTKIPGSRLRPPPPKEFTESSQPVASSSKRKRRSQIHVDTDEDDEVSTEVLNTVSRPFKGCIICFTGVPDKPTLFNKSHELGAQTEMNLTDTVTHLVSQDFTSEKYKVALSLGLPILSAEWIKDSHRIWTEGGEVDLPTSIAKHRLPIFRDLRICMSGFEIGPKRDEMIESIKQQKGFVSRVLDRSCTHLVTPTGVGEKVEWAKRVNTDLNLTLASGKPARKIKHVEVIETGTGKTKEVVVERDQQPIHVVWEEWVWDCLEAMGRWKEEDYRIEYPKDHLHRHTITQRVLQQDMALRGKDSTLYPQPLSPPTANSKQNVNSKSTNDDSERAVVKRFRRATSNNHLGVQGLVGDILSDIGVESDALPTVKTSNDAPTDEIVRLEDRQEGNDKTSDEGGIRNSKATTTTNLSKMSMSRSLLFSTTERSTLSPYRSFDRQASTSAPFAPLIPISVPDKSSSTRLDQDSIPPPSVLPFRGLTFLLRCGKGLVRRNMIDCVSELGGSIVSEEEAESVGVNYVVVKLRAGRPTRLSPLNSESTSESKEARFATHHWIENCYRDDKLYALDENIVHEPLSIELPVPGMSEVHMCSTRLSFREQEAVGKLMEAMGGTSDLTFHKRTTHLVCNPSEITGEKVKMANKWGTPVVSPDWVYSMAREGIVLPVERFVLANPTEHSVIVENRDGGGDRNPEEVGR
ncbi:Nucleotide excision repair factor NEF2, RAD4/CUT5 component [Phaffia rhodozyma]|uniref:Nucleotide excision repair factor NEF2, RAD4/CUT5 component n=1 Tax=Phaffia rhodozyma TaxID=264483 RepID=A0A0F7SJL4_PHARH|nr:Nucleotide excision repair factor NEF2, RAD4/CUT5 component [Phaffia rhodozyma]